MAAATSSSSVTGEFLQFIYSMLLAKNHQKIQSKCLVHEFFFTDIFIDTNHGYRAALLKKKTFWLLPFYVAVAYCCCEKVRRTMRIAVVSCFLKHFCSFLQLQSWIISRLRTKFFLRNFNTMRVVMEIAMVKIFNKCIAERLNNNYFPINESSSLY